MHRSYCFLLALATTVVVSCNNQSSEPGSTTEQKKDTAQLKEENITYTADSITANGYVVYRNDSAGGKRPGILVVHEWWGMNDYSKMRAKELADLGYVAMAVDMYGGGKNAGDPGEAQKLAMPFYMNPALAKTRLDAAIAKLKTYPEVDPNNIGAIGYCYGGYVVLNAAKQGSDLKAVVSFHGNLTGANPDKNLLKAQVLVCHGDSDQFVKPEEVAHFKKQMDSVGANYSFISYPHATHAFTNPASTETGRKFNMPIAYNEAADKKSWEDMKAFFAKVFGR